jgi:hypothetical protein
VPLGQITKTWNNLNSQGKIGRSIVACSLNGIWHSSEHRTMTARTSTSQY